MIQYLIQSTLPAQDHTVESQMSTTVIVVMLWQLRFDFLIRYTNGSQQTAILCRQYRWLDNHLKTSHSNTISHIVVIMTWIQLIFYSTWQQELQFDREYVTFSSYFDQST